MGKVEIFHSAEGWRYRTVDDGVVSEDAWPRASGALSAAGGDSLESVEIIYPEKEGRDTPHLDERPPTYSEIAEAEAEDEDEGSEV